MIVPNTNTYDLPVFSENYCYYWQITTDDNYKIIQVARFRIYTTISHLDELLDKPSKARLVFPLREVLGYVFYVYARSEREAFDRANQVLDNILEDRKHMVTGFGTR